MRYRNWLFFGELCKTFTAIPRTKQLNHIITPGTERRTQGNSGFLPNRENLVLSLYGITFAL